MPVRQENTMLSNIAEVLRQALSWPSHVALLQGGVAASGPKAVNAMLQVTAAAFDVGVSLDTAGAVYYFVTTPTTTATAIAAAASSVQSGGSVLAQGTLLSPSDVPSSVATITGSGSSSTSTTPSATNVTIQGVADSLLVNNPSRRRQLRQQAGPWQETTRALSDWHADTLRDWGLPGKLWR